MSVIRYQMPDPSLWQSLHRWTDLRDEINGLFEGTSPNTMRHTQLFNGWTPALDL